MISATRSFDPQSAARVSLANAAVATRRAMQKRYNALASAAGAFSLGAAFLLGSGEAYAGPKTMIHEGESFFNVGGQNAKQLSSGAMEITFENGQSVVIPTGKYGYNSGDLYISEDFLPYELAQAVMTPEQINGYIFTKSATAEGLAPVPSVAPASPTTLKVPAPGYLTIGANVVAVVGAAALLFWVLTKLGDAPDFEYPILTTSVEEGTSGTIFTAIAKDFDSATITYSLRNDSTAYDNDLFTIDPATGALSFINTPNFEAPGDNDFNNIYDVKIDATDADGGVGSMLLHVTVTDDGALPDFEANNSGNVVGTSAAEDAEVLAAVVETNQIIMNGGNDYVEVNGRFNGGSIDTGSENDRVVLNNDAANLSNTVVDLDSGDDVVVFQSANGGNYTVDLGTGADTVIVTTGTLDANPIIQLFTADDTLDLTALNLTTLDTGSYTSAVDVTTALNGVVGAAAYYDAGTTSTYVGVNSDGDATVDYYIQLQGNTALDFTTIDI